MSPRRQFEVGLPPAVLRQGARQLGRRVLNPALSWDTQRRRLDKLMGASPLPKGTRLTRRELNGVPAEVITTGSVGADRVVVHFHGGGYCVGSPGMARTWAARLSAAAGCQVVLPDYRLAPEHPYPAAVDDARMALDALLTDIAPARVVVSGDSAGGGLALALLLARRDAGQALPAGCILLSPWLDLGQDRSANPALVRRDVLLSPLWLAACAAAYAGSSGLADPSVSPLLADHKGLPPLLIQAGTDELLAPDAEQLTARASAAGVDVTLTKWPRMWHDFALQPGLLAAATSALAQAAWHVTQVTTA
ncbi:MAG TPA: alpha/beta hydrolase [Streptosporangiaceae bacterium]|nr:alpha/beta hydrolase [Streptosporangiaceae bacterium]